MISIRQTAVEKVTLAGIFLSGFLLRLMLFLPERSFWYDEWTSIQFAQRSAWQAVLFAVRDTHPPLYFIVLHFFIRALGFDHTAFQLPSLIFGFSVPVLLYFLTEELFDRKTALLAAGFASVSPFLIHLSLEVRNHGIIIALSLAAVYFFTLVLKTGARVSKLAYQASMLIGLYSHHLSWFVFAALAVWHYSCKKGSFKLHAPVLLLGLPALGILIYHLFLHHEISFHEDAFSVFTIVKRALVVYWYWLCGPQFYVYSNRLIAGYLKTSFYFWVCAVFFILSLSIAVRGMRNLPKYRPLLFFLSFMSFGIVLILSITSPSRVDTRYLAFCMPFFLIFMARGVSILSFKSAAFFCGVFIFVALKAIFLMTTLGQDPLHRQDYIKMTRFIAAHSGAEDIVARYIPTHSRQKDIILADDISPVDYYLKKLSISFKGAWISDWHELKHQNTRSVRNIWIIEAPPPHADDTPAVDKRLMHLGFKPGGITTIGDEFGALYVYQFTNTRT